MSKEVMNESCVRHHRLQNLKIEDWNRRICFLCFIKMLMIMFILGICSFGLLAVNEVSYVLFG